ncbi:MAG TPA: PDZ domain-containing protein, partial [Planctomycetota bacterium]|nr:PDZ domain-containing protein [Planctomycetota bacterium]
HGLLHQAWAVAIRPDLLVMADAGLRPADVEKIECTDASGVRFEASFGRLGRDFDFIELRPSAPRELVPLAFGEWTPPPLGSHFHVTYADRVDGRWHLNVSPYIQTNAPLAPLKGWFCIDLLRPGSVVADAKGVPAGIAFDQHLWIEPDGRSSFLGPSILSDPRVEEVDDRIARVRTSLAGTVKRVELTFRQEAPADRFGMPDDKRPARVAVFGLPIDDRGTLLVPENLARETIRKIEDLAVVDGNRRLPATFLGAFRSFAGFLVRAEGLSTRRAAALDVPPPPLGRLFFTAAVDDRFGANRVRVATNRLFRVERGLGGAERVKPRWKVPTGAFVVDLEGRVVGFATVDRQEEDLDEIALEGAREGFGSERLRPAYVPEHLRRLVFFSETGALLANPTPHFDAKAVPMTSTEEKRLVWFGVEFQEMSKPLAESLDVQDRDLTNDGRRGLLVTEVYAGSPAARAGVQAEDVLLSVRPEDGTAQDLAVEAERFPGLPRGFASRNLGPPWKPTRNYLTTLLTELGAGRPVVFEILRGREKRSVKAVLEQAPVDFETAKRLKNDALGLTVKDLTYEVRHFYRLDPAASGVVVAKIESGSRADIARLQLLSVIVRVNDVPVRDLAHFEELLKDGKGLTLTTVAYGRTKLVELSPD